MPFQFFGEKEIHYEFYKELNDLRIKDSRYNEMKIIREFPTTSLFKKRKDGRLKKGTTGKRAYIDLVIKHPSGNIGFEFFFGKQTPYTEKNYRKDIYFLRNRNLSPEGALIHTYNDCLKLKNEDELFFSWVVLFIAAYFENTKAKKYFVKNKRDEIINGLKKIRDGLPDNIRILYVEKSYIGDLNDKRKQCRYIWQSDMYP
jgi:hypothetical protein